MASRLGTMSNTFVVRVANNGSAAWAMLVGGPEDDVPVAITRDTVTIRGKREEYKESADDDYFHKELFWGGFTRTIVLPEEIVIDEAEAREKHGLLEIVLPKVDKDRSTKLKVKVK